jgi:polygalacturonase
VSEPSVQSTQRLQKMIDEGGHVVVPPGEHVVRTLHLRSGVTFEIPADATLLAHRNNAVFDLQERLPWDTHADVETSDFAHAVLAGRDLERVAIVGAGAIRMDRTVRWGPKPIALRGCTDVRVAGIAIHGAPNYSVSLGGCNDVVVERVTIRDALSDGIDPDSCRRVRIVDCDIESDDDAICLKSSLFMGRPLPCEDVEVLGCRTRSGTNGFKIGTETSGPVRRVRVAGCTFDARPRAGRDPRMADLHDLHEAGGVSIQTVDGADVSDIVVERVEIRHARGPISVRRGARGRGQADARPGVLRNVVLRDIEATETRETSWISGVPGAPVEDILLERVRVGAIGGGRRVTDPVPEREDAYPQCTMFGPLPAWGLYARHVERLAIRDLRCTAGTPDEREMLVLDDVTRVD